MVLQVYFSKYNGLLCVEIVDYLFIFLTNISRWKNSETLYILKSHCSQTNFVKTIRELTSKIQPRYWELINQTLFAQFFFMGYILKLERNLLDLLVGLYDEEREGFVGAGKLIKLNEIEFSLVLGLPIGGKSVFINGPMNSRTYDCYFQGCEFTRSSILKQILGLIQTDNYAGTVKLLILYLFATFLFSKRNGKLKPSLLNYVDDLDSISSYAWGSACFQYLLQGLNVKSKWIKARIHGSIVGDVGYLEGCTIALIVSS